MATEKLNETDAPGNNVYFVIWNAAGEVFDFNVGVLDFVALGSALTPYLAATENTGRGGVDESGFSASLDLAMINSTPAIAVFVVESYRRLGLTPAITTDVMLGDGELRVAAGSLIAGGSPGDIVPGYVIRVGMNVTSTLGDVVQLYAWAEFNGQPVTLDPADTCVFDCFEFDSAIQLWDSTTPVNPSSNGQFEAEVTTPDVSIFQDDVEYLLKATVVIGGVTLHGQDSFPVIGSA